jgi:hypothetical protein
MPLASEMPVAQLPFLDGQLLQQQQLAWIPTFAAFPDQSMAMQQGVYLPPIAIGQQNFWSQPMTTPHQFAAHDHGQPHLPMNPHDGDVPSAAATAIHSELRMEYDGDDDLK